MRKLVLTLLATYLFSLLFAQQEFAPIGARWYVNELIFDIQGLDNLLIDFYEIESLKDTVVEGITYRKVGNDLFYQDLDQVYYRKNGDLHLIYDFDVQVGDTVTFDMIIGSFGSDMITPVPLVISAVDTLTIQDEQLRKVSCDWIIEPNIPMPFDTSFKYTYIERMGSLRVLIEDFINSTQPLGKITLIPFLRCYQDDDISYQTPRFISEGGEQCDQITSSEEPLYQSFVKCYPNPFQSQFLIETNYPDWIEVRLYNALGQLVAQSAGKGTINLEVADLPSGHYYASLRNIAGQLLAGQVVLKN